MSRRSRLILPILLAVLAAAGCSKPGASAERDARSARLLDVLSYKFPEIAKHEPALQDLKPSDVAGLDEVTLVLKGPQGEQKQKIYVSKNDRILILGPEPIDASRPVETLKAERAAQERKLKEQATHLADGRPLRGRADAPVTVIEFSDFQCPYCSHAKRNVDALLKARGDKVRFVYRHFPLDFHPWARLAATASECAALQKPEAFWILHDLYFARQQQLTADSIVAISEQSLAGAGIDLTRWRSCTTDKTNPEFQTVAKQVDDDYELARKLGVGGTPGFMINGTLHYGVLSTEQLIAEVDKAAGGD